MLYADFKWFQVYDFLEFVSGWCDSPSVDDAINRVLERELAGYRLINGTVSPITDSQEVAMLAQELEDNDFPGVRAHLKSALELMSDKQSPNYRDSIKESISAVESLARVITKNSKATLGEALKALEKSGEIHSALKAGFSNLYGYTSDEEGIRHAMLQEPDLGLAEARFFLLACTSFIGYLKAKI
jgi:hypothetical protein